jgi:ABC-type branched-subunit amino acid transport system permease subunit
MAYLITLLLLACIATIIGLGLNLQWGVAGLVNFGVVGFVAIGAYTVALLAPACGWLLAMGAAAAICAALGALLALLSIRLSDDYLAIVTIGFGEVVRLLLLNLTDVTGGALGIPGIRRPFANWVPLGWEDIALLGCALALVAAVFCVLQLLVRSPFGRVLRAVRDDATASASVAKPVLVLRVKAFACGAAVMGIGGALHAFYITYIDPGQFTPIVTAYAFLAVIAGGRGSNAGLLFGASVIMVLLEGTRFLKDLIPAIDGAQIAALRLGGVGLGIILLLILRPQGLLAEPQQRASALFPMDKGGSDAPR